MADDISEIVESGEPSPKVTDEEVKKTRDAMMSTSKSGRIMSDDQIRKMLEDQKNEESKVKEKPHLMHSSKSGPAMGINDLYKFMEAMQKASPNDHIESQEPLMHSSKSFSGPVFEPKELKKIIEGKNQKSNNIEDALQEEDPFSPEMKKQK